MNAEYQGSLTQERDYATEVKDPDRGLEDGAECDPRAQQHVHSPSSKESNDMAPDYLSWMTPVVFTHNNGGLTSLCLHR